MTVEYRVLGPLEVLLDGVPLTVPAGRGRVMLATLLLRANEFVPVDELVERIWEGAPPSVDRARKTLHMVVTRLRQSLGAANCVRTFSHGYSAEVAPEQLDLIRFRELTAQGEHRTALELWRGPVLANVTSESLHRDDVPRLLEEQVVALERRIDADLARDTDVLVPELRSLVRRHPLRETFWAQLMLALHRSNRQAEALEVYREISAQLTDELGVDPGQRLREAHQRVLGGEVAETPVPRQLPTPVAHFVGRSDELARLTALLDARPAEPVLISAINGVGGVGKTALALQWAHHVAHRFPDGQVHVNLRGFDPRSEPVRPLAAVRDVLVALGIPAEEVPSSEDAAIARYRSELARRSVLLLLDNARDVDQVRPLLPGGARSLVLITSRNQLRGLVAREGARPVALDVLDEQGGLDLLTERIGPARIAAEPEAAARLVAHCAGLPLALGVVAARAAYEPSLAELADELETERLDALDVGDSTSVRTVFSWSLRSLSADAFRMFLLLGLHPGPDITTAAAASLAGRPLPQTRRLLGELVASSLLVAAPNGRFTLHDLVRDYAVERTAELPAEASAEASRRMFDHYLHTANASWRHLQFSAAQIVREPPAPGVQPEPIADLDAAWAWFTAEHHVLLGTLKPAEEQGADEFIWKLMCTMKGYLGRAGFVREAETSYRGALAAAQRLGDLDAQETMHRSLGGHLLDQGKYDEAEFHLREAIRCVKPRGDVAAEAYLRDGLAFMYLLQERHQDALDVLLEVYPRMVDHPDDYKLGRYLSVLGRAHNNVGEHDRALDLCLRAAELFGKVGFNNQESAPPANLETLADIYLLQGRHADALQSLHEALRLWRTMRSPHNVADCLFQLANAHIAAGEPGSARECLAEAVRLFEGMRDREFELEVEQRARDLLASIGDA